MAHRQKKAHLEVLHPEHCETMEGIPYPPGDPSRFFILVQGKKRGGIEKIFGLLVDPADPGHPHVPTYINHGSTWALGFSTLPMKAQSYILIVGRSDKGLQVPAKWHSVVTVEFSVEAGKVALKEKGANAKDAYEAIPVLYPASNSTVPPTFIAYGLNLIDPTTHATMGSNNGVPITNPAPPNGVWTFQFTNVPAGDYDLSVDNANAGSDRGGATNVTVDPAAGGPPAPPPPPPPPPP